MLINAFDFYINYEVTIIKTWGQHTIKWCTLTSFRHSPKEEAFQIPFKDIKDYL